MHLTYDIRKLSILKQLETKHFVEETKYDH
jgi:hypothetical protein